MKKLILLIAACVAVSFAAGAQNTQNTQNAQKPTVEGTWRAVNLGNKQIPDGYSFFTIFNSTHYAMIMSDAEGNIIAAVSGPYSFDGDTLIQTYEMSIGGVAEYTGVRVIISKITFDGKRMTQLGRVEGKSKDTENATWERVE